MRISISRSKRPSSPETIIKVIQNYLKKAYFNRELYDKFYSKDGFDFEDWQRMELEIRVRFAVKGGRIKISSHSNFYDYVLGYPKTFDYDDNEERAYVGTKKLNDVLKNQNWFLASANSLILEPLYSEQVKVGKYLYHFSASWNKDSILKKGLIPRGSNRDSYIYPNRVFLLKEHDENNIRALAFEISNYGADIEDYYHGRLYSDPLVIFQVDTSKINRNTKFYADPAAKDGVWTPTHIPAKALTMIHDDGYEDDDY